MDLTGLQATECLSQQKTPQWPLSKLCTPAFTNACLLAYHLAGPRRETLITDNASSISAISLCSSKAGRCCIMSCCTTRWAPALHVGNVFTQITQQTGTTGSVLQPAACQGDDVWQGHSQCLWHISSSGRGASSREQEDGAGLAEPLGWAGGADCRSCGHGRPRCFAPVALRANLPQRNAHLLPPNPSALTVKQAFLQYVSQFF